MNHLINYNFFLQSIYKIQTRINYIKYDLDNLNDESNALYKFKEVINQLQDQIDLLQTIIYNKCNHSFVKDTIDYGLDQTKDICYCEKCGFTKHY